MSMPDSIDRTEAPARARRTNRERTATTRARVLNATIEQLAEQGYAATTTVEVAERAGVSRGALVHHFPTRSDLVLSALDKPAELKTIVPDRPGHDRRYLLDSSKLRRELGWQPEVGWEDGLRATVRWYAENRAWWEPLKERAPVEESAWK